MAKQKILIVDDDNNIAELISLYLMKECFDTMIVEDGEKPLDWKIYPEQVQQYKDSRVYQNYNHSDIIVVEYGVAIGSKLLNSLVDKHITAKRVL